MLTSGQVQQAIMAYTRRPYSQCAVVVDGGWGVGKTYLFLNQILPKLDNIHYLHVSLYGLSSIADIENEIYKNAAVHMALGPLLLDRVGGPGPKGPIASQVGGVSYAVQMLVNRFHRSADSGETRLLLCFDDLERWSGDLNICLSYINKIVEQGRVKCIVLGNIKALDDKDILILSHAREKTIRHIYKFETPAPAMVDYALEMVDFQSDASHAFIGALIHNNLATLISLMQRVGETNIRTLAEAFQLYDQVVDKHIDAFNRSKGLAFAYFVTLLSTLILLKKHFIHRQERDQLVEGNHQSNHGFPLLKQLGYFDKESPKYLTSESRILLDTIFYRLDEISLVGVFSIIENGFYIESDFEGGFVNWRQDVVYENYLDQHYFYQLEEQKAESVTRRVMKAVFDQRAITNPATLLLLAERLLQDTHRRVLDLDFSETGERFKSLVRDLYLNGEMEVTNLDYLADQHERFPLAGEIFHLVLELNVGYLHNVTSWRKTSFWQRLANNPCHYDDLLSEFDQFEFLRQTIDVDQVITSLEVLSNAQVYQLSQRLAERLESTRATPVAPSVSGNAERIWLALQQKSQNLRGVRASNLEQLGRVFQRISELSPRQSSLSLFSRSKA